VLMLMGTIAAPLASVLAVDVTADPVVGAPTAVSTTAMVSAALLDSELHATIATRAESDNSVGRAVKRFSDGSPGVWPRLRGRVMFLDVSTSLRAQAHVRWLWRAQDAYRYRGAPEARFEP
jgi:hypothetical protein